MFVQTEKELGLKQSPLQNLEQEVGADQTRITTGFFKVHPQHVCGIKQPMIEHIVVLCAESRQNSPFLMEIVLEKNSPKS